MTVRAIPSCLSEVRALRIIAGNRLALMCRPQPGGSGGPFTITVKNPGIPAGTNFANDFIIRSQAGFIGTISNNTTAANTPPNTITFNRTSRAPQTAGQPFGLLTNDPVIIYRVLRSLDQPGGGKGQSVIQVPPNKAINTVTNSECWPQQILEPCLSWNNVYNPGSIRSRF